MHRSERTTAESREGPRTACNIQEDLSDVLHPRQRFERMQPFPDDNPERPSFVNVELVMRGATIQTDPQH